MKRPEIAAKRQAEQITRLSRELCLTTIERLLNELLVKWLNVPLGRKDEGAPE